MTSIRYNPDAELLAMLEEWIAGRKHIEQTIRKYSPFHCYRAKNAAGLDGHYAVLSYQDDGIHGRVAHGWDSFIPGHSVFGFDLTKLTVCDCGAFDFEPPEAPAEEVHA